MKQPANKTRKQRTVAAANKPEPLRLTSRRQTTASAVTSREQRSERQRLSPTQRRRHLIEEAVKYFAEVGFSGSTRELAKRVGVTQPLLYRYFPTKSSLIEAVYDIVYVSRWRPEWTRILTDRNVKLQDRLNQFYKSYSATAFTREWLRIYLFAGLNGAEINKRYILLIEGRILTTIYRELYAEFASPLPPKYRPTAKEVEFVWGLHSAVFYYAVRKHIFQIPVFEDQDVVIEQTVDQFLSGARRFIEANSVPDRSRKRSL